MNFTTNQRNAAKRFLQAAKPRLMSLIETDTLRRIVYEIDVREDGKVQTEVWIERESKLEEPEYFYTLTLYLGEPS